MENVQIESLRKLLSDGSKTFKEISDELGVSWEQVRHFYRKNKDKFHFPSRNAKQKIIHSSVNQNVEAARQRAYRLSEIDHLKKLTERKAVINEWRDALRDAALTIEPPKLIPALREIKKFDDEVAVLVIGDVHVGQHTPARLSAGYTQTIEVTREQFTRLGEKLLQAWEIQSKSILWKELRIIDLGDDVEGSGMRASQHRFADPLVTQQTAAYGRMLADLILTALQVFPKVIVERIPGNHGRTTERAGIAGLSDLDPSDSFDALAGLFTIEILRDAIAQKRVEIINHEGFWGVSEILGKRIIFEHGASLRTSGGSWAGIPFYGIHRAASNYRDLEGEYSMLFLGHYHKAYMLPVGFGAHAIGNGCFPPSSPFVAGALHGAIRPTQMLLSVHKDVGMTMAKYLYLDTDKDV